MQMILPKSQKIYDQKLVDLTKNVKDIDKWQFFENPPKWGEMKSVFLEKDDKVIGALFWSERKRNNKFSCKIELVYISPDYRGQKLSSYLEKAFLENIGQKSTKAEFVNLSGIACSQKGLNMLERSKNYIARLKSPEKVKHRWEIDF